jgi:ribosomal protein L29
MGKGLDQERLDQQLKELRKRLADMRRQQN